MNFYHFNDVPGHTPLCGATRQGKFDDPLCPECVKRMLAYLERKPR